MLSYIKSGSADCVISSVYSSLFKKNEKQFKTELLSKHVYKNYSYMSIANVSTL